MKNHMRISLARISVCSALLAIGCGTGNGPEASPSSSGGATTQGGATGTGGQTGQGGATTTASSPAGGSSATGGNASGGNAGSATGGTASGGMVATGGNASGGQSAAGGAASSGSTARAGSGGSATGGSRTAGSTGTGGTATGGSTSTAGTATGGSMGMGGSTSIDGGAAGSDGCNGNAKPPASPADGYLSIDVKGTSREYALELPAGYDGKTPAPVMFAFHGPFSGWGPTRSAMGRTISAQCVGKVATFVGHNPKEGDPDECAKLSEGKCPWIVDWETLGWPTVQYWTSADSCGDIGALPAAAFDGNSTTGDPLPCKSFAGCDANYPVTLCLYDYGNETIGPHAFPTPWGAKAVTDFFLGLPGIGG